MLSLTPASIPLLCQTILAGLTAVYLLALRSQTTSTRWLAGAMVAHALYAGAFLLSSALPVASNRGLYAVLGLYFAVTATIAALIQFAYTFLADPFPQERRRVVVLSGIVLICTAAASARIVAEPTLEAANALFLGYGIALLVGIVWAGAVHARQYRRFQKAAGRGLWPPTHEGQGHLAFGFLTDVFGFIGIANFLVTIDAISMRTFQYAALLGGLAVSLGYVVVFINHAREPTMVQGKLVGLALATVLAFLGLAGVRLFNPTDLAREAGNQLLPKQTVRLTPLDDGGYKAAVVDDTSATSQPQGRPLTNADLSAGITLPFAFPFFNESYTTVYPNPYGALHLDAPADSAVPFRDTEGPLVAALLAPPSTNTSTLRAFVQVNTESATFTWQHEYEFSQGQTVTLQATMRQDGSVYLYYDGPSIAPIFGLRGLWPTTVPAAAPVRLGGESLIVEPGVGLVDDFSARYRSYAHAEVEPLARIVLMATLFVLVFLSLFFRASLLTPLSRLLAGVSRIEKGERDARVHIRSSDELGALATGFNRMADAVQSADAQLKAYAEDLEHRVAERTASLQRALEEQHAMQAQLVQAEKLASLGRLTAGIAHEIKNPLNFVTNFATLSNDYVGDLEAFLHRDPATLTDADRAEIADLLADLTTNIAKIEEHGQRADGIVRGMLLHARGGEGERRPLEVNTLAEEFLTLAFHGMRARDPSFQVTLEREFDDAAGYIEGVPQDLGRVLLNLYNNAFEAVHEHVRAVRARANGDGASPVAHTPDPV